MDVKHTLSMIASVVLCIIAIISAILSMPSQESPYYETDRWFFYVCICIAVGSVLLAIMTFLEWIKLEKGRKLGENLFYLEFGVIPDKVKVLSASTYKYDQLTHGISTNSVRIKFRSQEQVHKGVVDIENERLYIKEPVFLEDTGGSVPVWKEITRVHRNGKPKVVEYYDANEQSVGADYLDEEGTLKKGSFRRYKGREVYWFPEKHQWDF